jgi:hypothetical protein
MKIITDSGSGSGWEAKRALILSGGDQNDFFHESKFFENPDQLSQ